MKDEEKPKAERAQLLVGVKFSNPADEEGLKRFPGLYDLMVPRFKNGVMTRQAAVIRLKVEGGHYLVQIEAPTEMLQTAIAVSSLLTMWKDVEAALQAGKVTWAPSWAMRKKYCQPVDNPIE